MSAWSPIPFQEPWTKSWTLIFTIDKKKVIFQIDPDIDFRKSKLGLTRGDINDPNYFRLSESFVKKYLNLPATMFENVSDPEKIKIDISFIPCRPRDVLELVDIMRFGNFRPPQTILEQFTEDNPKFFASLWADEFRWNWPRCLRNRLVDVLLDPKYESFVLQKIPKKYHIERDDWFWGWDRSDGKIPVSFLDLTKIIKYQRSGRFDHEGPIVDEVWEFGEISEILNRVFAYHRPGLDIEDIAFDEIKHILFLFIKISSSSAEGIVLTTEYKDDDLSLLEKIKTKAESHDTLFTPNQNRSIQKLCTLFIEMEKASDFSKESIVRYRSREQQQQSGKDEPLDQFNRPILYALAHYIGVCGYEEIFWKVANYTRWQKKEFDLVREQLPYIFVDFVCVRYFATTFGITSEIAANISEKAFSIHPLNFSKKEMNRNEEKKARMLHLSKYETSGGHKYGLWIFLTRDPDLARCILDDHFPDVEDRAFLIDQIRLSVKLRKSFKTMNFDSLRAFHFEKIKSWLVEHDDKKGDEESLVSKELMYSHFGRPFSDDPRMNVQDLYLATEAQREEKFLEQARHAGKAKKKKTKVNRKEFSEQQQQLTFQNTRKNTKNGIIFK